MAEIHIEKKTTNMMVWVIPVLLLLGVLWWMFGRGSDNLAGVTPSETDTAVGATMTTPPAGAGAVDEYIRFVAADDRGGDAQMHGFAVGGIRRLATALESLNPGDGAAAKLGEMRQQADALENSSTQSDRHSELTRAAFLAGADVFGMLPGAQAGGVDVSAVRNAAEETKAGTLLLEQKDKVDAFFAAASRALETMRRN